MLILFDLQQLKLCNIKLHTTDRLSLECHEEEEVFLPLWWAVFVQEAHLLLIAAEGLPHSFIDFSSYPVCTMILAMFILGYQC